MMLDHTKMKLLIFLPFLSFASATDVSKDLTTFLTKLVTTQSCGVGIVSQQFERFSLSSRLAGELQETGLVGVTISEQLQDMSEHSSCHLNIVIPATKDYVEKLEFEGKVKLTTKLVL